MAFFICCISLVYLTIGILYFGIKKKGYSHLKDTISELGETGGNYEKSVGFGLFLPTGTLLSIIALLEKENTNTMFLALVMAIGYIVAAFFPCDKGSPSSGTWKQQIHNLGGFIQYAGSIFFIFKVSENDLELWFIPFKTIGLIIIACVIITSIPKNKVRGLAQRIAELLLFGCLLWQL
jgi:hypothetical protein